MEIHTVFTHYVNTSAISYPRSRVRTRPKLSDFSGKKIHSMPSFGGEVKPSAPCRRFAACKRTLRFTWKLESTGKIDRPFIAQFRPLLTEVSHVAWHGAPLEMMDGTKGSAQRASSLRPRYFGEVDPETATHIYLVSSEKSTWMEILFKVLGTLLMYKRNNKGPRIYPCSTPSVILSHLEWTIIKFPTNLTLKVSMI
jgi:hypothetical protein